MSGSRGFSLYAFGLGWDVPLASLNNVENHLGLHNTDAFGSRHPVVISSPPLDFFPVRIPLSDAQESGDGIVYHEWNLTLYVGGYQFWLNTYFAVAASISVPMTIYDRDQVGVYARYNVYAIQPSQSGGDIARVPGRRGFYQIRQRFNDLIPSS